MLLRVPGLGVKAVDAPAAGAPRARACAATTSTRLRVPLAKVLPFVELADHRPGKALDSGAARRLREPRRRVRPRCSTIDATRQPSRAKLVAMAADGSASSLTAPARRVAAGSRCAP